METTEHCVCHQEKPDRLVSDCPASFQTINKRKAGLEPCLPLRNYKRFAQPLQDATYGPTFGGSPRLGMPGNPPGWPKLGMVLPP